MPLRPLLLLLLAVPLAAQRGALVPQQTLQQLVAHASTIIEGRVLEVRVEPHPQLTNLTTLVVKMQVEKTLKGSPGKIFTFRQYIWDVRDRYDNLGYQNGGEELLLMGPESQYGLSSPVGLEQGRFRITRDPKGNKTAVNGRNNAGLFAPTRTTTKTSAPPSVSAGPMPEPELTAHIQSILKSTPRSK